MQLYTVAFDRQGVEDANVDLEKNINDLEGYLRHLDEQVQQGDGSIEFA